jgi:hypothetical protein
MAWSVAGIWGALAWARVGGGGVFERRGRKGFAKGAKEDKEKKTAKIKTKFKPI